jgi:O-antigen ligase
LWEFIWKETAGRRLQGFGYGGFWLTERTLAAGDALNWFPRHSHNIYLETVVNLGVVGLTLLMAIGALALRRALQLARRSGLAEFRALAAILVAVLVNGLAEAAFVMPRDMALFAAAAVFGVSVVHPQHRAAFGIADAAAGASTQQRTAIGRPKLPIPSRQTTRWSRS